jgi:hypothetical protein
MAFWSSLWDLDSNWRVLYERGGYPVLIERVFGSGSIVLCSDSYFLSNEALRRERIPIYWRGWSVGTKGSSLMNSSRI